MALNFQDLNQSFEDAVSTVKALSLPKKILLGAVGGAAICAGGYALFTTIAAIMAATKATLAIIFLGLFGAAGVAGGALVLKTLYDPAPIGSTPPAGSPPPPSQSDSTLQRDDIGQTMPTGVDPQLQRKKSSSFPTLNTATESSVESLSAPAVTSSSAPAVTAPAVTSSSAPAVTSSSAPSATMNK